MSTTTPHTSTTPQGKSTKEPTLIPEITPASAAVAAWTDPRDEIEIGVLMANGQLAPRTFASLDEAEAWAWEGEQVVQYNRICSCDI